MSIGLKDSSCNHELIIMHETEKAYLLKDEYGREYWLPKNSFDEEGVLLDWGQKMLKEKIQNYEYKGK